MLEGIDINFYTEENILCYQKTTLLLSYPNFVWDLHLLTFWFLSAELSCLTLVVMQSVRFFDISEKGGQKGNFNTFSDLWLAWATKITSWWSNQLAWVSSTRLGELPSSQMPCFAINRREGGWRKRSRGPELRRKKRKEEEKEKKS